MLTGATSAVPLDAAALIPSARPIYADGEMADRIRLFPWEKTSLGAMDVWSKRLVYVVNLILDMQFPALLFWGPELLVFYNDAYLPLMSERQTQALGQRVKDCWSEAWHILEPQCKAVMEDGKKLHRENVLIPIVRGGKLCDVYWTYSFSPVREGDGTVVGTLIVSHDVTAKLTAERERDLIAANLKNVVESTTDGLVVMDKEGRYTYVNAQAARIMGLSPAEVIGRTQWELFPRIEETEFGTQYQRAVSTGKPCHFDAFYPEPLNAWVECHYYPSEHGLSVYLRDVTEQKNTETALRSSESRFRKLFESDLMGVAIPDRFGAFRESNDALLRMTGYTREDQNAGLVRWDTMTPPEYAHLDAEHIQEAAERGSCTPYEKEYIRKDGSRVPILCGYALLEGSEDEYIGFVLDLTLQKQSEIALREREERFRVLAESLPQLIWITNQAGENVYCNQRLSDYSGLTAAQMSGAGWAGFLHPADVAPTLEKWTTSVETGGPFVLEYRLRRDDGVYRYFLARAVPYKNSSGEIERWIGAATDIHDQKLAEDALRRSEKLATAGRLAASIAHEINNPLASVTNALYLAMMDTGLSAITKGYLQTAEEELRRVAQITTQTLRFHKQSNSPTRIDICDVVDSVLALFAHRLESKNIKVTEECVRGAFATCFADEMRQVVANLVSNALDATPQGGSLRVRVKTANLPDGSQGVKIVVADTGHGIAPAIMEHIFEPFVSTKEATGIGLGLWVSQEIVRKHGGGIRVRSNAKGQPSGTVFTVFIPSKQRVAEYVP